MTTLSTTEINALAAIVTGTEPTRTATKERAISKLAAALAGIVTDAHAARVATEIVARPDYAAAEATLRAVIAPPLKAEKPARAAKSERPAKIGKRAATVDAAQRGELPPAPDFSAETHKRFRAKLAQVVAAAEAGDIDALRAFEINPVSSSPKAIAKYRDLAVIAIRARKGSAAA